jgi:hypothetical protein
VVVALSAYAVVLALVYVAVGLIFLSLAMEEAPPGKEIAHAATLGRYLMVFVASVLSLAFVAVPFLPHRPWVWVYGLATIALGFTSVVTIPFSIGLLIFWIRPEVKRYYQPQEPPRVEYKPISPGA